MNVLVINKDGRPLMPTTPRKARVLLKTGKAKIIDRDPLTIQLIYGSAGYIQPVTIGIDTGYLTIGFSAVSLKEELIGGELKLLFSVSERLSERRKYRLDRRIRLRHRAPRFDNRRRPAGWLAPSIQHKLDAHIKLVERIKARLPITKVILETASFDIQKINNPEIEKTGYQTGEQMGYHNLTTYIRHRDGYKCQNPECKSKSGTPTQIHHLGYWKSSPDRSDRPANLITLCVKCHTPVNHQQGKFLHGWKAHVKSFKSETFMTTIYRRLLNVLGAEEAFGFETKFKREEQKLEKSHHNDAFVIAGGTNQFRSETLVLEQIRCNKRSMEQFYDAKYIDTRTGEKVSGGQLFSGRLTRNTNLNGENLRVYRGVKISKGQRRIKRQRYRFNPNDYVLFEGVVYRVIGMQNLGTGVKIADYPGAKNKVVNVKKVTPVKRRSGICAK
ncbi:MULTISPECIES: RNA-guided endonuclease IscB [unclassified Microcoleus]|uniref:RNA-guided endonuclease IscB n=1 Tax=unclassified Microcoleus TaxID=2642155 RepID=UPI002FD4FEC2